MCNNLKEFYLYFRQVRLLQTPLRLLIHLDFDQISLFAAERRLSFRILRHSNFAAEENIATTDLIRFYFVHRPYGADPSGTRIETAPSDLSERQRRSKSDPERETGIAALVRVSNNEVK